MGMPQHINSSADYLAKNALHAADQSCCALCSLKGCNALVLWLACCGSSVHAARIHRLHYLSMPVDNIRTLIPHNFVISVHDMGHGATSEEHHDGAACFVSKCSRSPVPDDLLQQSRQHPTRAAVKHVLKQQLSDLYTCPVRSTSPTPKAPLQLPLQQMLVMTNGKAFATSAADSTAHQAMLCSTCTTYSTENLCNRSTPHGPKYACCSRSTTVSPQQQLEDGVVSGSSRSIAAAWMQQQDTQMEKHRHLPGTDTHQQDMGRQVANNGVAADLSTSRSIKHSPTAQQCGLHSDIVTAAHPDGNTLLQSGGAHSPSANSSSSIITKGRSSVHTLTRNKAVELESALIALPAGQLLATQQRHMQAWLKAQQQQQQQQQAEKSQRGLQHDPALVSPDATTAGGNQRLSQVGAGFCEVFTPQMKSWQQHISLLSQQLVQQVGTHCVEHGRAIEAIQERYIELADALFMGASCLFKHYAAVQQTAWTAAATLASAHLAEHRLQQELSVQQEAAKTVQQQLATLTAVHEQLEEEARQSERQWQQLVVDLKQQLWQTRSDWQDQVSALESAAATEAEAVSRQLADSDDNIMHLKRQLAFVNEQLRALRSQQKPTPSVTCIAVQTEMQQKQQPPSTSQPQPEAGTLSVQSSDSASDPELSSEETQDVPRAMSLMEYAASGRKRSQLWLVKLLGQIVADKALADAAADRQGAARASMMDFLPIWSLNRYGLQYLSDQVLRDLCTSICRHAATGLPPARWFACFCGLSQAVKPHKKQRTVGPWQLPGYLCQPPLDNAQTAPRHVSAAHQAGESSRAAVVQVPEAEALLRTPAAVNFFVFCACQLAYPNSVVALFPEAQEALPLVRSSLVMESIKAAFRYLGDPAGQASFVACHLEQAVAPTSEAEGSAPALPPAAATPTPGCSRPGTTSSYVGTFGYYNAWVLLDALLAEWLVRAADKAQRMRCLRREVASMHPAFHIQCAAACSKAQATMQDKLQQSYAVLQPILALPVLSAASDTAATGGADKHGYVQPRATALHADYDATGLFDGASDQQFIRDATTTDVDAAWEAYTQTRVLLQKLPATAI